MKHTILFSSFLIVTAMFFQPLKAQDMNPKITTFLMFEGDAEEAMNFYTSLFDDSEIVQMVKYGADNPHGPQAEGTVQHASFTLKGKKYMAIDSFGHDFTFTP